MTIHRASCTDCPWTFEDEDLIEVSDELERHSQKEQHHVDMQRAVATDGGRDATETVELRIRTDRQNLAGIISVYGMGVHHAPAFGPAAGFLEDVLQGMEDVYPQEDRVNDMLDWMDDEASGVSRDLDVDLVELEGDPTDAVDGDEPDGDRESVDIPITDGGLPAFDRFAQETCTSCGERVAIRFIEDDECVGCRDRPRKALADGGEDLPELLAAWRYDATIHGADVDADCLALTSSGKPCSYNAYESNDLPVCNTHSTAEDPNLIGDGHQWARITDDQQGTVTVCVNCTEIWKGNEPETRVPCPECSAEVGERCVDESSTYSAPLPPHPERRKEAYSEVDLLIPCQKNPVEPEDAEEEKLVTDGGQNGPGAESGSLDLTAFQQNILVILSEEAMYGLAIKRELEDYYGTEVNHGRLYPNLDTLVGLGLVEKSELDKRTNQYALTDDGESVLEDQIRWIFSKYAADANRVQRAYDLVNDASRGGRDA